jgi:hypothetical protein
MGKGARRAIDTVSERSSDLEAPTAKPAHHKTRSSALHPWRLLGLVGLGVAALVVVDGGALAADRASAPRPTTADVAAALAFGDAPTGPCWTPSTPPKLTIVTVVDGWPRLAAAALRRNKAAYAATHGYRYCEFGRLDLGRPLSWSKFPAMKEALKFSEWAFWIDADAIFRDLATPLLPLVETLARPSNAEAVYSGEVRGDPWELHRDRWINTGAFAMKRTPWVASLLDRLHGYGARDQPGGPSASDPVWKSTTGLGGPDQTSELSSSVKPKSIRLIFGRIDCSRRVLEAQPKIPAQSVRLRAH